MAARIAVALVALAALGWLVVMERNARQLARATELAEQGRHAEALAALDGAQRLNPGTEPDVGRALVLGAQGRPERAAAVLEEVVRREPDNLTAWAIHYGITRERDPAAARRALDARRRLDPLTAPR